jgi:ABC-type iron transport system FetAB permease component
MTAVWIALIFVVWYIASLIISEKFVDKSRIGKQWLFFISFIFSPLVGFLVVSLTRLKD